MLTFHHLPFILITIGSGSLDPATMEQGCLVRPNETKLVAAKATSLPSLDSSCRAAGVDECWWQATASRLAHEEYGPSVTAQGLQASNRAQSFRTVFAQDGIRVEPRTSSRDQAPAWRWGLALTDWGREGSARARPAGPASIGVNGDRVEYRREGLLEWYVNDERGLEQGFTIARSPSESIASPAMAGVDAVGPAPSAEGQHSDPRVRLNLAVTGSVTAHVDDGGQVVDFLDGGGARAIRFDHLEVTDACGRDLPACFESVDPTVLAIVVDDRGATYPITIDPLATSPSWTASSDQASAGLGAVATAGDVNGDGYSDVIVGAPFYDAGEADEGRVFVYLGSAAGLATSPAWIAESNQIGAQFGSRVSTAGDVNGDGYSDVLVGASQYDHGQGNEGSVFLWLGGAGGLGANGTPANADWSAESDQADANLGTAIAPLGDVNGDGYADVAVGAWAYEDSPADEGRVFVWYGGAGGLGANGTPANADWFAESNQAGARLGYTVSPAGDVDGDGYADLLTGAIYWDQGQTDEGGAFVWYGGPTGLGANGTPANADWSAQGDQTDALLGSALSTMGDVNGDGYSDVIVAAASYEQGEVDEGWGFVWYGGAGGLGANGTPANADWSVQTNEASAGIANVACAGDVNGDGFADVLVGSLRYGASDPGRAMLWFGGSDGLGSLGVPSNADWSVDGEQANAHLGTVGTAGDVNGDGLSDLIVGAVDAGIGGKAYVYHGGASSLATNPGWTVTGDQSFRRFGWSVASAGDVNGDGFSDLAVGIPEYINEDQTAGRVCVYHGSAAGPDATPAWFAQGDEVNVGDEFGATVASAGDVNGDGYSDLIVGSSTHGADNRGMAFAYYGSPTGLSPVPSWTAEGDSALASFGNSVASAGDVNGDGYSDVVIGAELYNNAGTWGGRAYVYQGSATGLAATPAWMALRDDAFSQFGNSVASAGDVNGDGYSDVIIGCQECHNGESTEGMTFVYHGSAAGLATTPAWTAESNHGGARFGRSVAGAGDVNGDGFSDVIIGAFLDDNGQADEGRAFVYQGSASGLGASPSWIAESDQNSAFFGQSVATAGDVNGDGYSDVVVGAYLFDNGQLNEGRAFVYHGSSTGLATSPAWTGESDNVSGHFGYSVAAAGDVNGDGYSDVIAGAPNYSGGQSALGQAYLYYGNQGDGLDRLPNQARSNGSAPIAILGRSDSETSFRVKARGRTPMGRGRVRLEYEVKALGVPLNGTGLALGSTLDTGVPTGGGSFVSLSELVAGLSAGSAYHWRSRIVTDSPFFPRSRWFWPAGNSVTETDLRTSAVSGLADSAPDDFWRLGPIAPNPFEKVTEVSYLLQEPGRVRISVFDVNGRRVSELLDAERQAGRHRVRWDGKDGRGVALPSGIYFARLVCAGRTESRTIVLTR